MERQTTVNCVFCNKSLEEHTDQEVKFCMAKHLQVQNILQQAIGDKSKNCDEDQV